MSQHYDVVIIGGGPAGSTVATLLRKYRPELSVAIFERERFPRDHVGESQLPVIGRVLAEMGVWEKVEAAGFPIKIGATYRWGQTRDLWDFEFLSNGKLEPEPRPAKFEGQRTKTAFQVDRAIYDQVLLEHAKSLGCNVFEQTSVRSVQREDDSVTSLTLADGESVTAKYYVDASGHAGILRRAMGVETHAPTLLQNIAIWDYWRNADWAVEVGVEGTRVQVLSIGYGWIWFIPLGPDRTSIGLITSAEYYKKCGKKPTELYLEAISSDERLQPLMTKAVAEGKLSTTKDWSFVANRLVGQNWFLAGESAGFADPILAAGMSLAHVGGRDVAYTILGLEDGEFEADWLKSRYDDSHRWQIQQHIRFADFWYSHNGVFSDLKDYTKEIAGDAGLFVSADEAWRWFGQGGFIDHAGGTGFGGYGLFAAKEIAASFTGSTPNYAISGQTHFKLNLDGATEEWLVSFDDGKITRFKGFRRDGKYLVAANMTEWLMRLLSVERSYTELRAAIWQVVTSQGIDPKVVSQVENDLIAQLEAMVGDGWIRTRVRPGAVGFPVVKFDLTSAIHENREKKARGPIGP